jgi:hypothetical protein
VRTQTRTERNNVTVKAGSWFFILWAMKASVTQLVRTLTRIERNASRRRKTNRLTLTILAVILLVTGCAARKSFLGTDPCFYPLEPNTWGCAKESDKPEADEDEEVGESDGDSQQFRRS